MSKCNNPNDPKYHYKVYKTIRENGGWDNWIIESIYFQEDLTEKEAKATEQVLMNDFGTINDHNAYTDKKEYKREYKQKNKEAIAQKDAEYRQNNKEKIAEYHKQRRAEKITCECGSIVSRPLLARHRRTKKHIDYINNKK